MVRLVGPSSKLFIDLSRCPTEVPRTPLRTPLQMVRRQTRSVTKRLESAASSRREIEPVTPSPPRVSKKRKAMDEGTRLDAARLNQV